MDETERQSEERGWDTAKTLAEALPYIQVYDRETVVIKYGGHAMGESAVARQFAADVVLLKLMGVNPVVVHGGGPQISAMLDKAGVKSSFVDGLRVTDRDTMQVAEMVLSGAVNKEIAHWITVAGKEADVRGIGLSGKDAGLLTKRMLLLTDVPGVKGKDGQIIRQMNVAEAEALIQDGTAHGGMIPKLQTAIAAVRAGVEAVVILDGRRPHAMLVELFTEHGAGTLVKA